MTLLKIIVWLIVLALAFLFASLNNFQVSIHFLAFKIHVYLPILLFLFVFFGALLGYLMQFMAVMRLRYRCRQSRKEVERLSKELKALRLTVASEH